MGKMLSKILSISFDAVLRTHNKRVFFVQTNCESTMQYWMYVAIATQFSSEHVFDDAEHRRIARHQLNKQMMVRQEMGIKWCNYLLNLPPAYAMLLCAQNTRRQNDISKRAAKAAKKQRKAAHSQSESDEEMSDGSEVDAEEQDDASSDEGDGHVDKGAYRILLLWENFWYFISLFHTEHKCFCSVRVAHPRRNRAPPQETAASE